MTRRSMHFPLARSSTPKPRSHQTGVFFMGTVTLAQPATAAPSTPVVAALCAAEILGLAGFSIVPALLPQFIEAWSLTNTQAGWLAGIVSAGYMLAVIPLVGLTDRRPARHIYLASSGLSALSCFGMALCDSLLPALGFRALVGIAMAGMYMPGLRALTHGVKGATRPRIAAWYTSSFTIGASLSFLFGRVGTLLGWRSAFVIAGILGAAGVLIAWAALPRGDSGDEEESQPLLDFRPVLANRDVLALIVGYAAAIWGCVGLRQWIVVFLTFCAVSPLLPITGCAVAAAFAAMSHYSVGSVRCWGPRGKAASMRASSIFDKCNSPAPAFSSACVGLEALGIVKSAGRRVKKASAT